MSTVLITGVSRGLGLEFARQYARAGWQVIATCRTPDRARDLAKLAKEADGRIEVAALDMLDPPGTQRFAKVRARQPIDLLVANAGLVGPHDIVPTDDDDAWTEVMRVNVMAPTRLAMLLADAVAASRLKQMAFVSSHLGSITSNQSGGLYVYRSSKAELNAVVKSLAIDLKARGITAVALHPGWVRTDMGGSNADIAPSTSIAGMVKVLAGLKRADSGRLIDYKGTVLPW
ncbi:MAG: SDR family oxidoreductase [Proteobacteria bacterium]|nr:SDR family oxidoreductase [Pseudomonadota bacterium]